MGTPLALRFLGAAGTVTGSRFLLDDGERRLLVDCGLFQGYKVLRERNRAPFPVEPDSIDAVVLTHAHLDHSGYLPLLVKNGYTGPIHCSEATRALCGLLLPDSGRLLEEEAARAAHHGYSAHARPQPLYTEADARHSLRRLTTLGMGEALEILPGWTVELRYAGHILGAAQVTVSTAGRSVHFSGDIGRSNDILMLPPAAPPECDVLVCESTYGDRAHPTEQPGQQLATIVKKVAARGGVVVIPAFAVGRAQALLLHLFRLRRDGLIPPLPVFVNSPMATDASRIYAGFATHHRVSPEECAEAFAMPTYVGSVEASKRLNRQRGPMVIISASGMMTGGRVLHHLTAFGPDRRNAIVLVGYQAGGTRGARLASGERRLRIFGQDVPIAAEVFNVDTLSSHPDAGELIAWIGSAPRAPDMTYVVHGEPAASDALRQRIKHELRWPVRVPDQLETVAVTASPSPPAGITDAAHAVPAAL